MGRTGNGVRIPSSAQLSKKPNCISLWLLRVSLSMLFCIMEVFEIGSRFDDTRKKPSCSTTLFVLV